MTVRNRFNGQKIHFIFHLIINQLLKYAVSVLRKKTSGGKKYKKRLLEIVQVTVAIFFF